MNKEDSKEQSEKVTLTVDIIGFATQCNDRLNELAMGLNELHARIEAIEGYIDNKERGNEDLSLERGLPTAMREDLTGMEEPIQPMPVKPQKKGLFGRKVDYVG